METQTVAQKLESLDWNIKDTMEAMNCAIGMSAWDGVIKYANQLKDLHRERFDLCLNRELTSYSSHQPR